jgi:hypothetical protein
MNLRLWEGRTGGGGVPPHPITAACHVTPSWLPWTAGTAASRLLLLCLLSRTTDAALQPEALASRVAMSTQQVQQDSMRANLCVFLLLVAIIKWHRSTNKWCPCEFWFGCRKGIYDIKHVDWWSSTWGTRSPGGTRRYLWGHTKKTGYVKIEKTIVLFRDKHWIIRARPRVSHRRPGRKDIRVGSAFFLSLSLIQICFAKILLFLY